MIVQLRRVPGVVLVVVLALLYVWIGVTAHGWDRLWGIAGGVLVLAALPVARRSRTAALVLLALGGLPLALATWWSIVTPLLAILVLVIGVPAVLHQERSWPTRPTHA